MTVFKHMRAVAIVACVLLAAPPAVASTATQDDCLCIVLIEGEDRVNIIERATAVPTLVEVRDRNDLPVAGLLLLFRLGDGGTATLNTGLQQVGVTTDALGRAAVSVNPIATGEVELSVTATFEGETVTETILQTNFATVAEALAAGVTVAEALAAGVTVAELAAAGVTEAELVAAGVIVPTGGLGTGAIVGIVAAAGGAAGVAAAVGGGKGSPPPPPPPPVPQAAAPSAPRALRLVPGDGQMGVSWGAPADDGGAAIDDYDLRYRPAGGGAWTEIRDDVKQTVTSLLLTGLRNGTTYEVQVRAGNSAGDGPWSARATGTPMVPVTAPSAPAPPMLRPGNGQMGVSWSPPSSNGGAAIDDYDLRYRPASGAWTEIRDDVKRTVTSLLLTSLTNGTTYDVQVRAGNSVGDGPWSESATGTPMASASVPSAPSAPRLTEGDGQMEVRWTPPTDDGGAAIDDYDVQYRPVGGSIWRERPDTANSTATTDIIRDLTNGTTYEVQVRAENSVGESDWSEIERGTPRAAAMAPDPPVPTLTPRDGELEVRWSAPEDNGAPIFDYDVRYRAVGSGAWAEQPDTANSTATTDIIRDLTNGTTYEVQVRAENSVGESDWSEIERGTPRAAAMAPDPPAVPEVAPGDGELEASWSPPEDNGARIFDYDVRYRAVGSGAWAEQPDTANSTATTDIIRDLTNGTTYEVQVRAENLEGESDWSDSGRGTPMASAMAPEPPSAPEVTPGGVGELVVRWLAPEDNGAPIEYYKLQIRVDGEEWKISDEIKIITAVRITDLINGTTYEVQVRAANSVGESDWSESGKGTTPGVPDAPAAPWEVRPGDGELVVRWLAPEDNGAPIEYYKLRIRADGEKWNILFVPDDGRIFAQLTGLINGTTYEVQVRAANSVGESDWSESGKGTPAGEDDRVDPVQVQLVPGHGQLRVDWAAPSDDGAAIDDYDVRYRPDTESGVWTELPDATESTETSATITDLANGTVYQVQVRASNAAGDGAWSATATGTPSAPVERLSFGDGRIEDQMYRQYTAIAPLELPSATGGVGVVTYALSPALPSGLVFDAASRTISGTPSVATSPASYTYTATDAAASPSEASLSFTLAVEASAEEAALRRDALAAQGRALLSSVTGVIGERFRPRSGSTAEGGAGTRDAAGSLVDALASMLGLRTGRGYGAAGGVGTFMPGLPPGAHPGPSGLGRGGHAGGQGAGGHAALGAGGMGGLPAAGGLAGLSVAGSDRFGGAMPAVGSVGGLGGLQGVGSSGFGDALSEFRPGSFGFGRGDWDSLAWGQSFAAPLGSAGDGAGLSRYTVWGAGDRQSFSGSPAAGRYSGDMRSLYVGADGRIGTDWLAGAAVGRSWGSADYSASAAGAATGRLTTRLTSVYPYVRGQVSRGLELWAIGGYGRGAAADARGADTLGAPGELTMRMGAAGLRQDVLERGGVALAVVGGAGSLSLSTAGSGLTVAGLGAGVHRGRLGMEMSRASGVVSPFVQLGGRYDGGDGQTGAGLELVGGLRASMSRLDLEARGRWLSAHSASGYEEYGAAVRLALKSRRDGTGLRALLSPRWGMADELSLGEDGLLGGAGSMPGLQRGAGWTPPGRALSLDGELGYGWRARRLRGVVSPLTSYRRTGFGGDLTQIGFSYLSSKELLRGDVRMQFTLGREQWLEQGTGYQLAVTLLSVF